MIRTSADKRVLALPSCVDINGEDRAGQRLGVASGGIETLPRRGYKQGF